MKRCEFCGAILPEAASFCGKCGHVPSQISQKATLASDLPTSLLASADNDDNATILTPSGRLGNLHTSTNPLHPVTLVPIVDDEEEEEKRRRAALLGLGIPVLGDLANQPTMNQMPGIQGTPQMNQMPGFSGAPTAQGGMPFSPGAPSVQNGAPSLQTSLPGNLPPHPRPPSGHSGSAPGTSGGSTGLAGCLTVGAVIAASLLIILATVIGLSLTVFAPQLSLSGSSSVISGSMMTLHGSSFRPNSSVTLTLDGGTPLYVLQQRAAPARLAAGNAQHAASAGLVLLSPAATNVVPVQGDGTFTITFQVNPTWAPGQHTIHASESVSHRSTSLPFTIILSSASATPTATPADTPAPTPTVTATATPSPTPTTAPPPAPALSCISSGTLALGPVSELSSQTASGSATLCTSGAGVLTWQAGWDQKQAPWLQMAQKSGSVQTPDQFTATISASAANLVAGTYTTTITFIGLQSNTTEALKVTFTVQAGCLRAPTSLAFTATTGSNPASQSLPMTNCGLTSDWSGSAATTDPGNWLAISPSKGTLKGNSSTNITVTVTSASLSANNYKGSITLKLGSKIVTVTVNLTVNPPQITAQPASCDSSSSTCTVTLINSSSGAPLNWSVSASQEGVTMQPGSGTIPAGGQETVMITFAACTPTTVTFSGPGNSVTVSWNCELT